MVMIPRYLENGPVKVVLDSNTDPIVAGFGAGFRVQLARIFRQGRLGMGN
jgi:hypothetical protein